MVFKEHDFFTTQTTTADAYVLRNILHDWPDKSAVKILQNLIPAMKEGAKVILVETVLMPPGVLPPYFERVSRFVISTLWHRAMLNARPWSEPPI